MSRLGRYRSRAMTRQRKYLALYVTAAAAFHAGAVAAGWAVWQVASPSVEPPQAAQPIEFVYLDAPETQPAENSARRAQVSQKAAGEKAAVLPANAGKAVEFQKAVVPLAGSKATPLDDGTALTAEGDRQSKPLPQPAAQPANPPARRGTAAPPPRSVPEAIAPQPAPPAIQPPAFPVPVDRPAATPSPVPSIAASGLPVLSPAPFVPPAPVPQPPVPSPLAAQPPVETVLPPPPDFLPNPPLSPQPLPEVAVARNAAAPPPAGQGLDGTFNPDMTTAGTAGLSAQRDPVWGEYVTRLNHEVHEYWQQVAIDRPYQVTVRLTLDRAGNLLDLQLAEPSGFADADAAAIAAVQQSAPFEPFPATASRDRIRVNLTFKYNLVEQESGSGDQGSGNE